MHDTQFNNKARKLKAEAKQMSLSGIVRGANLQKRCITLPSATNNAKLSAGKASAPADAVPGRVILLQFPSNSDGERSQETLF